MTLSPLLLVLFAALAHASWNLFAKRAARAGPVFVCAYNLVSCIVYLPLVIYELVEGRFIWSRTAGALVLASGAIHLGYSLFLQQGYQKAELSVVYPVARGTGPMLSTIAAILLLGEAPKALGLLGLVLVIVGILLIATRGDLSIFQRRGAQAGLRYGGKTGGLIACYTVVDAYGVKSIGLAPVILDWTSNFVRFLVLAPLALSKRSATAACFKQYWIEILAVGLLSPLGYILVLAALSSGAPLAQVAPMREMSMMIGALLGMAFLKEKLGVWRLTGCAVLSGGVILLAIA